MEKIKKEQLEKIVKQQEDIKELLIQIGGTESQKHAMLHKLGNLNEAIELDFAAMDGLDAFADIILDSTDSDPSGFRTILLSRLGLPALNPVPLSISSFSFRKGVPEAVDYVFDTRFLNNPHWQEELRHLTGIDREVQDFVQADIGFQAFMSNVSFLQFHVKV